MVQFYWLLTIEGAAAMIEFISKTNHIITNHGLNGQSKNVTFGFRGNDFNEEGVTTIRPKRTRKVHFNPINGGLARCSIYDRNNK